MLSEVNPLDPDISNVEAIALMKMLQKREQYVEQGRAREAHGAGTMIWILWRTLKEQPLMLTNFGEFNGGA